MLQTKVFRSFLALALACVMSLGLFIAPAFASDGDRDLRESEPHYVLTSPRSLRMASPSPAESFGEGFWGGLGAALGGSAGAVVVCYTVDVAIAPVAPPVAAYLATVCPAVGGVSGAAAGWALAK